MPAFVELTAPLLKFLELVYQQAAKQTKRATAQMVLVPLGFMTHETQCFANSKLAVSRQVTLPYSTTTGN